MDATKAAVAHADDVIAWQDRRLDLRHQLIDGRSGTRPFTHGRQRIGRIPIETGGAVCYTQLALPTKQTGSDTGVSAGRTK